MKGFIKFLGICELIGSIAYFIIFFIALSLEAFKPECLSFAIVLLINALIFFYLSDLGERAEELEWKTDETLRRLENVERLGLIGQIERIDSLEKELKDATQRISRLEQKKTEKK